MNPRETELGFEIETETALVFFGKSTATAEALGGAYPFSWARVRQTHSDIVVESTQPTFAPAAEADAHWTRAADLALLISTADCVPVFLVDPARAVVAAVHAGWRGVAARIVQGSVRTLAQLGPPSSSLSAFIGPHIGQRSFEVGDDVAAQLFAASDLDAGIVARPSESGKLLIDLHRIVRAQLDEVGVSTERVFSLDIDTKTDVRFHSHRRDRERAGRQLSFVVLRS